MCLDEVTQRDFDEKVEVVGYKRFIPTTVNQGWGESKTIRISPCQGSTINYPLKKWLNEKDFRAAYHTGRKYLSFFHQKNGLVKYPYGFHIFQTKKGSKTFGGDLYKVKGRLVKVMGKDCGQNVYVCEEMLIVKKVTG